MWVTQYVWLPTLEKGYVIAYCAQVNELRISDVELNEMNTSMCVC